MRRSLLLFIKGNNEILLVVLKMREITNFIFFLFLVRANKNFYKYFKRHHETFGQYQNCFIHVMVRFYRNVHWDSMELFILVNFVIRKFFQ